MKRINLGINIDHAATLRNARGENDPSLVEFALAAQRGGADLITFHLREDRRHIRDKDIFELKEHLKIPINFEMALTEEMVDIAASLKPYSICIVPEKREELTTEGGFAVKRNRSELERLLPELTSLGIAVYLFVEADPELAKISAALGVAGVEVHTGNYAHEFLHPTGRKETLRRIKEMAEACKEAGLDFHAGHGLNYHNIHPILEIENLTEVNIGHAVLSRALFTGIKTAIDQMNLILEEYS